MADSKSRGETAAAPRGWRLAVLNLDKPPGVDSAREGRFRAAQIGSVVRFQASLMAGNMVSALAFAAMALAYLHPVAVALWTGMLVAVSLFLAASAWRRRAREFASAPASAIRRAEGYAVLLGVIWAAFPPLFFADAPPDLRILMIAQVLASAGIGAFAMASIPSAAISYTWLLTTSLASVAVTIGTPTAVVFGVLILGYGVILTSMILASHRSALKQAAGEADFERRGEIISLLLKDFEQGASDWLWETDDAGKLVYFSDRMAELLLRSPDRLAGATLRQAVQAGDDCDHWRKIDEAVARREAFSEAQIPVRAGDTEQWWLLTAKPILGPDGGLTGYRGVGRDVSEARPRCRSPARSERGRRGRQRRKVAISRHHEPRTQDAAQCHRRLFRPSGP